MPMAPALSMPGCGSHRRKAPRDKGDDPSNVPAIPQREWPEPRVPAKFEQGGFTSGRRRDVAFSGGRTCSLLMVSPLQFLVLKRIFGPWLTAAVRDKPRDAKSPVSPQEWNDD